MAVLAGGGNSGGDGRAAVVMVAAAQSQAFVAAAANAKQRCRRSIPTGKQRGTLCTAIKHMRQCVTRLRS
jgi:NAD(P)H-hydrate repair Nnr-like enzyme with NAD(P)H-hydrate epimerase domain